MNEDQLERLDKCLKGLTREIHIIEQGLQHLTTQKAYAMHLKKMDLYRMQENLLKFIKTGEGKDFVKIVL